MKVVIVGHIIYININIYMVQVATAVKLSTIRVNKHATAHTHNLR